VVGVLPAPLWRRQEEKRENHREAHPSKEDNEPITAILIDGVGSCVRRGWPRRSRSRLVSGEVDRGDCALARSLDLPELRGDA